jgi:hypothetical protein
MTLHTTAARTTFFTPDGPSDTRGVFNKPRAVACFEALAIAPMAKPALMDEGLAMPIPALVEGAAPLVTPTVLDEGGTMAINSFGSIVLGQHTQNCHTDSTLDSDSS